MKTPRQITDEYFDSGTKTALEAYVELKRIEAQLQEEIERIKPHAVREHQTNWRGEQVPIAGAIIKRVPGRTTYKFLNHPRIDRLAVEIEREKDLAKAAYQYEQKHPGMEFIDEATGEVIAPAVAVTSEPSVSVTLTEQ